MTSFPFQAPGPGPGSFPPGMMSSPILPEDPPRIGDFWLDERLLATPAGIVYVAHGDGVPVLLVLLSAGAAGDAAARDRLAGVVNEMHIDTVVARGGHGQDEGRLGGKFRDESDDPVEPDELELAPWVAIANDRSFAAATEARRILDEVALATLGPKGTPSGPDYKLHWIDNTAPGMSRLWPLPWPGRHDRAGWVSILTSWLLMLLIAALAVLIAILIFQNNPPGSPPPPVPPTEQQSGGGEGSPSSSSASPTNSESSSASSSASSSPSESPSGSSSPTESASADPVPSHTKTPTFVSPTPGGTATGGGSSETPNHRL